MSWAADGANRNDQTLLGPTLAAAHQRGLLCDVETLHLDRGYAGDPVLKLCESYGIHDVVRAPKRARGTARRRTQDRPAGDALDHRAHQLMAIELRAATAQHRPQHHRTPRTTRTRRRADHHRQTPSNGPTDGTTPDRLFARALSDSESTSRDTPALAAIAPRL